MKISLKKIKGINEKIINEPDRDLSLLQGAIKFGHIKEDARRNNNILFKREIKELQQANLSFLPETHHEELLQLAVRNICLSNDTGAHKDQISQWFHFHGIYVSNIVLDSVMEEVSRSYNWEIHDHIHWGMRINR